MQEEHDMPTSAPSDGHARKATLKIGGMSCASCAVRIEKALSELPGVEEANVNLALERATVKYDPSKVDVERLKRVVTDTGYTIRSDTGSEGQSDADRERKERETEIRQQRRRFAFSAALSLPLLYYMFGMLFRLPMPDLLMNHWFQFALATPVQFVAGWHYYRGAYHALKGGAANMDVLIALGTSAAYLYSTVITVTGARADVYFEASSLIIALITLGKLLEAIAKGRTSEAIKKLMGLQAKTARVVRDGA
ncbi:MAG TPA: cation-translocating P-type ATPase, partial [Firmicutes bacterium]|nr:cation-translocating P-type ATPase [Bacillota bacterium]